MLTRRKDGIGEAFSHDGGRTWGKIGKFCLGGPNSRFHIRKLHSGHILLINHWSPDNRFDTPRGDDPDYMARNNLAAFLSVDDGKTWSAPLLLDERELVSIQMRCKRRTIKSTSSTTGSEMSKRSCCWRGSRKRIFCAGNWFQMDRF